MNNFQYQIYFYRASERAQRVKTQLSSLVSEFSLLKPHGGIRDLTDAVFLSLNALQMDTHTHTHNFSVTSDKLLFAVVDD